MLLTTSKKDKTA